MTLSYETAKRLKDAGFPQKGLQLTTRSIDAYHPDGPRVLDNVYFPTLEELIEECGNPFMLRWFEGKKEDRVDWKTDYLGSWQAFDDTQSACDHTGEGDNPKEAVAELYIAIKKKT